MFFNKEVTIRKFNIAPKNRQSKRKLIFQPSFFRGYVKFRGCTSYPQFDAGYEYPDVLMFCWKRFKKFHLHTKLIDISYLFIPYKWVCIKMKEPKKIKNENEWISVSLTLKKTPKFQLPNTSLAETLHLETWNEIMLGLYIWANALTQEMPN